MDAPCTANVFGARKIVCKIVRGVGSNARKILFGMLYKWVYRRNRRNIINEDIFMSPAISFSAVEVLPALLDKTKTQTIRPQWKTICIAKGKHGKEDIKKDDIVLQHKKCVPYDMQTLPRLKVGDKVKLYWKMRSKDKLFCSVCGKGIPMGLAQRHMIKCKSHGFPKLLGEVEITEVFEIEMGLHYVVFKEGENWVKYSVPTTSKEVTWKIQQLAMDDGFKDFIHMFRWFDKEYDLSSPKRFAVYRFRWL